MAKKQITYLHSGTLGDLIYSLSILPKMPKGKFLVGINNIDVCSTKYGYGQTDPAHAGRFTETDYEMLLPLLKAQPYISSVGKWNKGDKEPDVCLDDFRNVLFRKFRGNYIEAYHKTFDLPYSNEDVCTPWLHVDPIKEAKFVVTRTPRYQSPNGNKWHKSIAIHNKFNEQAIFVGKPEEHEEYEKVIGMQIPYYPVKNFLHMAQVIAGSEGFIGNQTFAYSLAVGVGVRTALETQKNVPLAHNECYFKRPNAEYF